MWGRVVVLTLWCEIDFFLFTRDARERLVDVRSLTLKTGISGCADVWWPRDRFVAENTRRLRFAFKNLPRGGSCLGGESTLF